MLGVPAQPGVPGEPQLASGMELPGERLQHQRQQRAGRGAVRARRSPEDVPWSSLQEEDRPKVLLRQQDVPRGEAMRPSQLPPSVLPVMWQLYPGQRYRSSDSGFWRILYHIRASLCFSGDPLHQPGGPCSQPPRSGLCSILVPSCLHQKLKK